MNNLGIHVSRPEHFRFFEINQVKRGEFFNFRPESVPQIKQIVDDLGLELSIHSPLIKPTWYEYPPTWTFLCDFDDEKREKSIRMIEQTLYDAAVLKPQYVVVHFPSPAPPGADEVGMERQEENALESICRMADVSKELRIPIHLEGFGPSPFLDPTYLTDVMSQFPSLRYCLDVAHTYISSQRDGFEYYRFVEELLPFIGSLHLWNTRRMDDYLTYGHIPLHPSEVPEDGWVDIEKVLSIVLPAHPECPIILEQGGNLPEEIQKYVSDHLEGITWIKKLIATYTS